MRFPLLALALIGAACGHTGPSPSTRTPAPDDAQALCAAQRSENRHLAEASRCVEDDDCLRAGQYETASCDAWVTQPDAKQQLGQMRAATDAACRDLKSVQVAAACPDATGKCVAGRCMANPSTSLNSFIAMVDVLPEDMQCIANGMVRVNAEKKLPLGLVQLRFPVPSDGFRPRYFEAIGPHDPEAAVGVARVFGSCRWRMRDGQPIPPGAWGSLPIKISK